MKHYEFAYISNIFLLANIFKNYYDTARHAKQLACSKTLICWMYQSNHERNTDSFWSGGRVFGDSAWIRALGAVRHWGNLQQWSCHLHHSCKQETLGWCLPHQNGGQVSDQSSKKKYKRNECCFFKLSICHVRNDIAIASWCFSRGDQTSAEAFLTVLPQGMECVVFSIDGSFAASVSLMGSDPKVRPGAVDVVRWVCMYRVFITLVPTGLKEAQK